MSTRNSSWTGWIAFAGILMVLIGAIDVFQGLIAIIRDNYYFATGYQVIVFDTTTWGWITLLWGIVILLAGFGLLRERVGRAGSRSLQQASTFSASSVSSAIPSTRCGPSQGSR